MVRVKHQEDLEDAVEQMLEWIGKPITSACQYYTLYYLVEVEDVDELGFKLMKTGSKLRDSFYNYSVYATGSEAANLHQHFYMDSMKLDRVSGRRKNRLEGMGDMSEGDIERKMEEKQAMRDDLRHILQQETEGWVHDLLLEMMITRRPISPPADRGSDVNKFSEQLEKQYNAFTDADTWFDAMRFLFGYDWDLELRNLGYHGENGWSMNYGGDAWASIPDTAELIDEMGKNAYVDLMWSVEHNNGNFIDKVPADMEHEKKVIKYATNKIDSIGGVSTGFSKRITKSFVYSDLLPNLLDAVKEGNLRFAYHVANRTITDVNLRKYRSEMPDTPVGDEPIPVVVQK